MSRRRHPFGWSDRDRLVAVVVLCALIAVLGGVALGLWLTNA